MRKMRKNNHHTKFRFGTISIRIALLVILAPAIVILLYRWLPLPSSAFMIRQRLSGVAVDYRWVSFERISPNAALAIIASEDQNFFDHWGIDFKAIADAMEDNQRRSRPRGGSTISQQLAKNLFLWPEPTYRAGGWRPILRGLSYWVGPKNGLWWCSLTSTRCDTGTSDRRRMPVRFFLKPPLS